VYAFITDLLYCLVFNVQDSIQALVEDCNFPAVKKSKNIESFLTRCKLRLLTQLIRYSVRRTVLSFYCIVT